MANEKKSMQDSACACGGGMCGCGMGGGMHHHGLRKGPFIMLALLMLSVWLGFKARNEAREYQYIGVPVERNVISVSGTGKVIGKPDLAEIDLGMVSEKKTVKDAQDENTRIMNALYEQLGALGVKSEDIQTTGYTVSPSYDWNNGRQTLRGYTVSQNAHVKVRLTGDKPGDVGAIIGAAGTLGANQVGGIQFTVDHPDALQADARKNAIEDAKAKAQAIAAASGISLEKIVSFNESSGGGTPMPMYYAKDMAMGGANAESAPSVQAGTNEYRVDVTLTYQIR